MKDLSYTQVFPTKKVVTHEESLIKKVRSGLIEILREEGGVSEKSFDEYDKIIKIVDRKFNEIMKKFSINEYKNDKRIGLICELLYDQHFKNSQINESKISKFNDFI
jgi:hypothetical protein